MIQSKNLLGQLFIIGINGIVLSEDEIEFIEQNNIGGVILFTHNYESPAQLVELVNSIQKLRDEYPLFISVDQEGGRVQRFKNGFSIIPPMQKIAKIDSPKTCFEIHKIMAEELRACGINVNFAPCCDVLTHPENKAIGDRSFSDDPEEVSKLISSAIRGLQTNGVLACAKHFPGHGATGKDSHVSLPIIKRTIDEIEKIDMPPFAKAAKARVEFFMMGHLVFDALDENNPASLSRICHDYVREKLKYSKIIISDDLEMGAILDKYTLEEAAYKSLQAGSDMVLFRSFENAKKSFNNILKQVNADKFNISEKVERVNNCKKTNLSNYKPIYVPEIASKLNIGSSQVFLKGIEEKIKSIA